MRINEKLLDRFYADGEYLRRENWPAGDHVMTDGAEGGTIWYYAAAEDELTAGYKFGFHELCAEDWAFWYPPAL